MKNKDELNYRQAYYHLFNQITEIIRLLMIIQREASEICIDEPTPDDIKINTNEVLKKIINELKNPD